MRQVTLKLTYSVPAANYCTERNGDMCRFCETFKNGRAYCRLYDTALVVDGSQIEKARACCKATAGFETEIEDTYKPMKPVDPKIIIKETIKMYNKAVNDLLSQGYPRPLAEKLAQQHILGG